MRGKKQAVRKHICCRKTSPMHHHIRTAALLAWPSPHQHSCFWLDGDFYTFKRERNVRTAQLVYTSRNETGAFSRRWRGVFYFSVFLSSTQTRGWLFSPFSANTNTHTCAHTSLTMWITSSLGWTGEVKRGRHGPPGFTGPTLTDPYRGLKLDLAPVAFFESRPTSLKIFCF